MKTEKHFTQFVRETELSHEHVPDIPLCRFFSKQEYADSFANGQVRFVNLSEYRNSEFGVRSDPTELESENNLSDGSFCGSFSNGSCFAICFTEFDIETEVDHLKKKFGNEGSDAVLINIESNLELTKKIQGAWKNSSIGNGITSFRWYRVAYNKSDVVESGNFDEDLYVYQKPKRHIIHRMKRILKQPIPPVSKDVMPTVDMGGEVGTIRNLSSLNLSDIKFYEHLMIDEQWIEIDPEVNNFEIEREWRLVFFSDYRQEKSSGKWFLPMKGKDCFLSC